MEDVPLNDAQRMPRAADEGLRRRPTRTQSGSRVDEYRRAPSLRRTKSGASVASPPEIARVRSLGWRCPNVVVSYDGDSEDGTIGPRRPSNCSIERK